MNNLQIFNYQEQQVRSVLKDGAPYFVAADVCAILDQPNISQVVARLDEDEKGIHNVDTPGGKQVMTAISEAGLYAVILTSRKPEARQFKRWVTHEVLPSIRQTGKYELPIPQDTDEQALILAAEVTRLIGEKRQLQVRLTEAQPKVEAFDSLMDAQGLYSMQATAQLLGMGRQRLFAMCRQQHIIQPLPKRTPYQRFVDAGYFQIKAIKIERLEKAEYQPFVTPKGLEWLRHKLNEAGQYSA